MFFHSMLKLLFNDFKQLFYILCSDFVAVVYKTELEILTVNF